MLVKLKHAYPIFFLLCSAIASQSKDNKPQMRIVNGAHAAPGAFPWQLQLQRNRKKHCGATMISKKWAITAAHCISAHDEMHVMAGSNHWNSGTRLRIVNTIIHPHYDRRYFLNDIALLNLELDHANHLSHSSNLLFAAPKSSSARAIKKSRTKSKILWPEFNHTFDSSFFHKSNNHLWPMTSSWLKSSSKSYQFRKRRSADSFFTLHMHDNSKKIPNSIYIPSKYMQFKGTATVTGWGLLSELDRTGSDFLQAANVNILSKSACRNYKHFDEETQICAGYENGGTDACAGDSGGGLITMVEDSAYVIGVVSYGLGCGRKNFPGVYTKVSTYSDWIKSETDI